MEQNLDPSITEDGRSLLIGILLMVAITLILATIIAAFVFGFGSQGQNATNISITETSNETIQVQLNSVHTSDHIYVQTTAGTVQGNVINGGVDGSLINGTDAANYGSYNYSGNTPTGWKSPYNSSFLYANGIGGGTATIVTVDISESESGEFSVISVDGGYESVLETYEYNNEEE